MAKSFDKPQNEKQPAEKKRVSVKNKKALKEIERMMPILFDLYSPVLAEWDKTTEKQREEFLQHSPILAKLLDWVKRWEINEWRQ
jgi:hypothetical protein